MKKPFTDHVVERPVELHRHLDGSLRDSTLRELAARQGVAVPPDLGFYPGMGLQEALARFVVTLSVLQQPEAVRRVAREMCKDAAAEGVCALEIRFAPQLHRGAPPEAIVDAALEGMGDDAGLILCGLYGEPPAVLERLVEIAATRPGVVGIDLAGGPTPGGVPMSAYAPAYRRAETLGIGRTVHAAEGRPPHEIRSAIEDLRAQRIGHGTTLLDDPAVADLVVERGVTIEACLTSNWQTGAIARVEDHPLPRWLALGVRATVCCDNTLLSATDMRREMALVAALPGMTGALLERAVACGHAGRFTRA